MKRVLLLIIMFAFLFSIPAYAYDIKVAGALAENSPITTEGFTSELKKLVTSATDSLRDNVKKIFSSAAKCLAAALLCIAADTVSKNHRLTTLAGSSAILMITLKDASSVLNTGTDVIEKITALTKSILPAITAAAMTSGGMGSENSAYIGVLFAGDVICSIINRLMIPTVFAIIALSFAASISGNSGFDRALNSIYGMILGTLKIIIALFAAYLMTGSLIGKAGNALAVKSVKIAAGTVPVIGSVIGDAAETVIAGAAVLKNSLGIAGLLGIAGVCILPFITLGLQYLSFLIVSIFIEMAGGKSFGGLLSNLAKSYKLILAMMGSCCLMLVSGIYMLVAGTVI